ncbi:PhzF family phenazine biosynthesis protein [Delftia tsuruhatensis]|uniref:Phenazine biosynthesis protein PhzF n=3 Tax=Bacteria TaxID=2 RepID=A0ABM6EAA7_9BURK|nr:PhzF family phenazine biosynthesis protein [Delftia tsuruhatensis]AOV04483.1 phenazine biosynthesis protein PhzF [Delftia tsuruhatensis]MDH2230945.1 PhzF family phenazine biosynthesis protein [Delftia tsuruhatensis]
MSIAVHMVDVFASGPLSGNPLAVITGGQALTTAQMQQLTRWFNLSETAFLLPPTQAQADYRVRIFTLDREMPFAGHPTLGSCHAWLSQRGAPQNAGHIVQECGAGLVQIRQEHGRLAFAAPPMLRFGAPTADELDAALRMLGITAEEVQAASWIDNGPGWLGIRLASAEQVLALNPARQWPTRMDVGVVGPYARGIGGASGASDASPAACEVRAFFSDHQGAIVEDPVTGSLNASLAQWLFATGVMDSDYVAAQGRCLGRDGRIFLTRDGTGQVWVGGTARTHVEGALSGL